MKNWFSAPYIWGIIAGVGLDQVLKRLATHFFSMDQATVVNSLLSFQLVHNFGAAYGILQNERPFLLGVSFFVLAVCFFFREQLAPSVLS